MDDLISREAVYEALNKLHGVGGIYLWDPEEVLAVIEKAPAVVVCCKDCIWFDIDPDDYLGVCQCGYIATNDGGKIYPERDFFCPYGERRKK